jgi:ribonucleotide reductase beta subunit family protein with ferritin-like domain
MSVAVAADQVSYADLYARWEQSNWSATELDFSLDRRHWTEDFSEFERRAALWTYAMFFHGEDSVADNLSPFIDAAPRQEQKYFLATQQVDEARHAVLFGRFMSEVAGAGRDTASALAATEPQLTWGFRKVFERLDQMADELRRDRSRPKLAQAIALYHLVIEATLAQPGQHFIERSLTERDQLPALREGIANVSRDEQRHIAFARIRTAGRRSSSCCGRSSPSPPRCSSRRTGTSATSPCSGSRCRSSTRTVRTRSRDGCGRPDSIRAGCAWDCPSICPPTSARAGA